MTWWYTPKRLEEEGNGTPCSPQKVGWFQKERGIINHVAHVEVEVETATAGANASRGFSSSSTGGRADSTGLSGGELVLGRLATESVGELVDCEFASGGVPVECV